jgi:exopolysaccharide production protein ExoZ
MSAFPTPPQLTSIQSLRGFAALAVCIAHLHAVEAKFGGTPLLGNWVTAGFAGVDLFFVISGFVMVWVTHLHQGEAAKIPRFWLGRLLRIYPLWWLVLSMIVVVWLVEPTWVYSSHLSEPNLLKSYLLFPDKELPLHAVGWTLIHEVWFYLVFGLLLALPKPILPFALLLWATIVAAVSLLRPSPGDPVLTLIRHPLAIEFIIGALVGILATKRYFPAAATLLKLGLFLLLLAVLSIASNPSQAFSSEWTRVLLFGAPFGLILWGWVGVETSGQTSGKWSQKLGDWSYALYLIHVPVFVAIGRVGAPLSREGPFDNLVLIVFALAGAIFAAYALHELFEKRVQIIARSIQKSLT